MEYHKEIASGIAGAKGNAREMLEEFKVSTVEQKTLIFEVFDRVARLQNLVVSEVSWLYTVRVLAFQILSSLVPLLKLVIYRSYSTLPVCWLYTLSQRPSEQQTRVFGCLSF